MTAPSLATELRMLFLSGVGWTVIGQLYILAFIATVTFGLLLLRRWRKTQFDKLDAYYGDAIMNDLLEPKAGEYPLVRSHRLRWYEWLKRSSLKRILLNNIRSIAGHEKQLLVQSYCLLGFANQDRDRCYSMFWWRRLDGVSNLSGLDLRDSAEIFNELRRDREDLVAMAATLALSGIKHSLNDASILARLSIRFLRRRNLLLQIANNWAQVYGAEFLIAQLKTERRDQLVRVFVAALADLNTSEVGAELIQWVLADDRRREPQTLIYILRTLKTIGDPASVPVAETFLSHADENVRCEALDLILRLGSDEESLPSIQRLAGDSSVAVQRVLRHAQEKRVAA